MANPVDPTYSGSQWRSMSAAESWKKAQEAPVDPTYSGSQWRNMSTAENWFRANWDSLGKEKTAGSEANVPSGGSDSNPKVSTATPEVKPATPDLIQITEEGMAIEIITDLLFEDIGGTEILNIARHDLVNGIDIKYQQISNLAKVESNFGGNNLINLQSPIEQIFNKFALKRYQYIPEATDDPSGLDNHVYLDSSGNLNIELINLAENMQVEIEFKTASTTDIIY